MVEKEAWEPPNIRTTPAPSFWGGCKESFTAPNFDRGHPANHSAEAARVSFLFFYGRFWGHFVRAECRLSLFHARRSGDAALAGGPGLCGSDGRFVHGDVSEERPQRRGTQRRRRGGGRWRRSAKTKDWAEIRLTSSRVNYVLHIYIYRYNIHHD